jgi:hypothetical protein
VYSYFFLPFLEALFVGGEASGTTDPDKELVLDDGTSDEEEEEDEADADDA